MEAECLLSILASLIISDRDALFYVNLFSSFLKKLPYNNYPLVFYTSKWMSVSFFM